jgi:formate dehydrogenase maturation protein FdhE
MFDGETEASMLERDAGYEYIEENAEDSAFTPPTPQEMAARIDAARKETKEMRAFKRKDARREFMTNLKNKITGKATPNAEETVEEIVEEVEEVEVEETNDQE